MARIAGRVEFFAGGKRYELGESVSFGPFTTSKEMVVGVNGPVGHKETGVAPFVEVELATTPETLYADLENFEGPVTLKLANGRKHVLTEGVVIGTPEPNPVDGKVTVRFEGMDMVES